MKICLVADHLPSLHKEWSGAELVALRLWKLLEEEGQEVTVVTIQSERQEKRHEKISLVPMPFERLLSLLPIDPISIYFCLNTLKNRRPHIVHLVSKKLSLSAFMAAKLLRIPIIFTVVDYWIVCSKNILKKLDGCICRHTHGAWCAECFSGSTFRTWIRRVGAHCGARMLNYFARELDMIITFSNTSKERLKRHGILDGKIHVLYCYYHDFKADGDERFSGSTALFIGSFHEHKGLHIVVEAMPYVVKEVPDATLMVVGTGDKEYEARVKNRVSELGLNHHVLFLGNKTNEEVLTLVKKSSVVVVAEQWFSDFGPLTLVEAMSLSRPVVASRIGAIPEFVEDGLTGYLVDHDRPKQFADKMIVLLRHEKPARLMGQHAGGSVGFLDKEELAYELLKVYNSVVCK